MQLLTNKHLHITFIYNHNHELQRQPMWGALQHLSNFIQGAWCLLGDFNAIMSKEDRFGGNIVTDHDIQEMSIFIENCEVLEMPSSGALYTGPIKLFGAR